MQAKSRRFLAVDIGNTETSICNYLLNKKKSITENSIIRVPTGERETGDSILGKIYPRIKFQSITALIISSVVPPLNSAWEDFGKILKVKKTIILTPKLVPEIKLKVDNPSEVGIDIIINAWMGFKKYGGPLIVIDMGTATTFDVIDEKGNYLGGIIAPGMALATDVLSKRTAKLPRIELSVPDSVIGKNTVDALRSGIVLGHIKMIEGLLLELSGEIKNAKIIGTGGLINTVTKELPGRFDIVDKHLTLDGIAEIGMKLLQKKNKS